MKVNIPLPLLIVIDDVGWWSGEDGNERGEPYRTGIARNHVPRDYEAIALLGKGLNMKVQAAMVLCEWDSFDTLKDVPSATWMGNKWKNKRWNSKWIEEAREIINHKSSYIEVTLHGLGHEYWTGGKLSRAEWFDDEGSMRPEEEIRKHLDYYFRILKNERIKQTPRSFVPAAFNYSFNAKQGGLASILKEYGIYHISTPFSCMHKSSQLEEEYFGLEAGIMVVDRGEDLQEWDVTGEKPAGEIDGPICGMHWPNILHADPEKNETVVKEWINFVKPYDKRFDRILSRDTESCWSQLAYHSCVDSTQKNNRIIFNLKRLRKLNIEKLQSTFTVKIQAKKDCLFRSDDLEILDVKDDSDLNYKTVTLRVLKDSEEAVLYLG